MERELMFRIVLEKPPEGVDFALQKGKGNNYEIVQKQRSGAGNLRFTFTAKAASEDRNRAPNLRGPFVQGRPDTRFVYVGSGTFAGQTGSEWSRRLKIPLSGITEQMIDRMARNSDLVFEAHVPGTGKDGGPNCATVTSFAGWKLAKSQ